MAFVFEAYDAPAPRDRALHEALRVRRLVALADTVAVIKRSFDGSIRLPDLVVQVGAVALKA